MDRIKQYEPLWDGWYVEEEIGSGGFGAVYKVSKQVGRVKEYAAVKLVRNVIDDKQKIEMKKIGMSDLEISRSLDKRIRKAEDEIIHMSQLKGISEIVSIEDYSIYKLEDQSGYDILIRMELLTSLDDYLVAHSLRKEEVIQLGIDICTALEYCEQLKIVHKDIKPSNIFVNPRFQKNKYKLGDFGLARRTDRSTVMSISGTADYISPEVFRMDKAGYGSDIYCLGLMMYTLCNHNRLPFDPPYPEPVDYDDRAESIRLRLRGEELPPPSQDQGRLWKVIQRACQFDKKDRYQSASEMKRDLLSCMAQEDYSNEETTLDLRDTVAIDSDQEETFVDFSTRENIGESEDTVLLFDSPKWKQEKEKTMEAEYDPVPEREETGNWQIEKPGPSGKGFGKIAAGLMGILALAAIAFFLGRNLGTDKDSKTDTQPKVEVTSEATEQSAAQEEEAANAADDRTVDLDNLHVGGSCSLGVYEQDNDTGNGGEMIEWTVLAQEDDSYLLISDKVLDCVAFNKTDEEVTWETCDLRQWLNEEFYHQAFNDEEREKIKRSTVTADRNPEVDTDPGDDTEDYVFALSVPEAKTYFDSKEDRSSKPTVYAVENGVFTNYKEDGNARWWLRTPGHNQYVACDVYRAGSLDYDGEKVYDNQLGVRPAMWVTP